MMSAILGTLFILGGSAKLCCCFCCFACRRWSPGGTNPVPTPRTFPRCTTTVSSAQFFDPSLQASQAPDPVLGTASCTRTFLQRRSCGRTRKGEQPQKKSPALPGTLARDPRLLGLQSHPRPRAALPAGPSTHTPDLPGPRTLQSTATASGGMMSASSPHLGSSFLASFWAKAELNVTFTMARPGAPSEGGGGLEAGAAGSWLQLQPPRPGSGRGSAAAEERWTARRRQRRLLRHRSRSLAAPGRGRRRLAPPGAGSERGGLEGRGRRRAGGAGPGAAPDSARSPRPTQDRAGAGPAFLGCGPGFSGSEFVSSRFNLGAQCCRFVTKSGELFWVCRAQRIRPALSCLLPPPPSLKTRTFGRPHLHFLYVVEPTLWSAEMFNTLYPCDLTSFIFLGPHPRALPHSDLPCLLSLPWKFNTFPAYSQSNLEEGP